MHAGNGRRFFVLLGSMLLLILTHPAVAAEDKDEERKKEVAALVNGSPILEKDLERGFLMAKREYASMGKQMTDEKIRAAALENLINQELLYQASRKSGVEVSEEDLNSQFEGLKQRFASEEEFQNKLEEKGVSAKEIKSTMGKNLTIQRFVEEEFVNKIEVPEEELKAYYEEHPDFFKTPEQVKASHILIKCDPNAGDAERTEARKKIERVKEKLEEGGIFADLAQGYSEGPSKDNGGALGYIQRGQTVKPFEEAAFALKPGEISDIVETKFGFHLIQVTDKKPAGMKSFEESKERIQQYLQRSKVSESVAAYLESLKEEADIVKYQPEPEKE